MSLFWLCFIGGCAVLAFCGWAIVCGGAMRQVEAPHPLPVVRKARGPMREGFCPYCQRPGTYLTHAGIPNRRYHVCQPAAVQAHVWPPAPADVPKEAM